MKAISASFRVFSPHLCARRIAGFFTTPATWREKEKTSMNCPNCNSERIVLREAGRKTGGAVGAVAGATAGAISVMRGAQLGASVGMVAGPVGMVAGGLTGAAAAILFGGSAGAAIGSAVGSVADEGFLDNRRCLGCDLTFREEGGDAQPSGLQPDAS